MKLGIVNDSVLATEAIRRAATSNHHHEVIWTACDGAEAVRLCEDQTPQLVLMDMLMPRMDGVEATRLIMQRHPCPILIVTASVNTNSAMVFQALGAGALDAVATPSLDDPEGVRTLLRKIQNLQSLSLDDAPPSSTDVPQESGGLVLIGSSAGGPAALAALLAGLPANFPAGVVIVQHIDERFTSPLVDWLHTQSGIPVRPALSGDLVRPGEAVLAVRAEHLAFGVDGRLEYRDEPRNVIYRPSIDVLFESALGGWTKSLTGVLLTGMGRDGATGLKKMRQAGHFTIAQDRASSALYGMPKAAAELGAACEILPLDQIAARLRTRFKV